MPTLQWCVSIRWTRRALYNTSCVSIRQHGGLGLAACLLLAGSLSQEAQLRHRRQPHGQPKLCHRQGRDIEHCLVWLQEAGSQVGCTTFLSQLLHDIYFH